MPSLGNISDLHSVQNISSSPNGEEMDCRINILLYHNLRHECVSKDERTESRWEVRNDENDLVQMSWNIGGSSPQKIETIDYTNSQSVELLCDLSVNCLFLGTFGFRALPTRPSEDPFAFL